HADPDPPRQRSGGHRHRDLARRGHRVSVLLVVVARAVAVLEVDAIVLDRFALQLLAHLRPHPSGEAARLDPERLLKPRRVAGVGIEGCERELAEPRHDAGAEEMRSAEYGVDRLTGLGHQACSLTEASKSGCRKVIADGCGRSNGLPAPACRSCASRRPAATPDPFTTASMTTSKIFR